jgi:hypothetical protein
MFLFAIIYRNETEWVIWRLSVPLRVCTADNINNNNEMSMAISVFCTSIGD